MRKAFKILLRSMVALPMLVVCLFSGACQQQCEQLPQTPYQHLSDATWRAVETTDPRVTISNYDFIVMAFNNDFTGNVTKVVQNQQYSTPVEVFTWAVPQGTQGSGDLRIQYSTPGSSPDPQSGDQGAAPQVVSTDDYNFNLTNELELTETSTGYYWRFVPMVGIVQPDSNCTF